MLKFLYLVTYKPLMAISAKSKVLRISGKLKELVVVRDEKGNVIHRILNPMMVELYPRDLLQIMVGASILAIPVAFTEEVWNLGGSLPIVNVFGVLLLSLVFISLFVYYNFYRGSLKEHKAEFFKRILSVYLFSFLVVSLLLTLIQRAPWQTDMVLALKRAVLVSFPASMSAAVSDMLK